MITTPPKLDLRRLPSETALLFSVLAGVLAATLLGGAFPVSLASLVYVVLFVAWIVLSLRDFLRQPERVQGQLALCRAESTDYPHLTAALKRLSAELSQRVPTLWIAAAPGTLFAFGTWTRHGLAVGPAQAAQLDEDLRSPHPDRRASAEAALLHELHHFRWGDHIWLGLARSALRTAVGLALWSLFFWLAFTLIVFAFPVVELTRPEFIQQASRAQPALGSILQQMITDDFRLAAQQSESSWLNIASFVCNAYIPILIGAGVLYLTVWPRLLQLREYHADAGAAETLATATPMRRALAIFGTVAQLDPGIASGRLQAIGHMLRPIPGVLLGLLPVPRHWVQAFAHHPSARQRAHVLEHPEEVMGHPLWLGLTAGLIVTIVDLSLSGPLTVMAWASVPGTTAVILGFLAVALWLTPRAIAGTGNHRVWILSVLQVIGLILLLRSGLDLLNLLVLWGMIVFTPELAREILTIWVGNAVRSFQPPADLFARDELLIFGVRATISVAVLAFEIGVGILLGAALDYGLKRATLTWYGLRDSQRVLPRVWWLITLCVAVSLGGVFVPLVAVPVQILERFTTINWAWLSITACLVPLLGAGLAVFGAFHWRRRQQCAAGHPVPGGFRLGRRCPTCGAALHGWLGARY